MDEMPEGTEAGTIEKINSVYRRLNFILDKQYYSDF